MKIMMIQPNYHCGGAEIAGNWPPGWVAYIGGALKHAGFENIRFVDAMSHDIDDDQLRTTIRDNKPDVVMATAITPMIYKAQNTLKIAREELPDAKLILGGIHPTFMYRQVLTEAPWIDYIVRGEGELIVVNLMNAIAAGNDLETRRDIRGITYVDGEEIITTPSEPPIKDIDSLTPDWSLLDWDKYIYIPLGVRVAVPNFARGCPFTCRFCSQWMFWRDYRVRDPKLFVDEVETLVKEHNVGFFILADEEPTIHRRKFIAMCEELIERDLGVPWGINTRVTDILRDEKYLPLYRKAGLVHVSLGTEAASQLNLDTFRKQTTVADNKRAIQMLKDNGIVVEAQFIMGMENETPETIQETWEMAMDWQPDMVNWNMYTPWPFAELFEDLGDRVEVRDYSKYNFTTPIMKPDTMTREEVLSRVLRLYAKWYSRKALLSYPWQRDKFRRRYLMGCLKAFAQSTVTRQFYDIGRVHTDGSIDLGFDETKIFSKEEIVTLKGEAHNQADLSFGAEVRNRARDANTPTHLKRGQAEPAGD
jgi:anaerobic magnesium-protoporphyrin IX monomethyl ester cyclase